MKLTAPKAEYLPRELSELLHTGRCPHAVLLTGGNAASRQKAAYTTAAALVCENRAKAPCGKCAACVKTKAGSHPDILVIEGKEKTNNIAVKVVRTRIRETLYIAPNEAACKVYVLLEADGMNAESQNAFLKSLEEPPPFVAFVLVSGGVERLFPTVLSRCTQFVCDEKSEREGAEKQYAAALAAALATGRESELVLAAAPLQKNRLLLKKTCAALLTILRDAAASDSDAPMLADCEREAVLLGERFDFTSLAAMAEVLRDCCAYAAKNANENLLLAMLTARLGSVLTQKNETRKDDAIWPK